MRTAFISSLCDLAEVDPRIWVVCGDLGFSVLEPFMERFPERYVNAGVAEQNMTGVAAGLALAGKIPFTYSIANFPVMRCLEQIRNDVCYPRLNVNVVAVGGGFSYGAQGYSHHGIEDLAVLRCLPGMTVVAPGDPIETRLAVRAVAADPGPCYLRLGRAGEPQVHEREFSFVLGRAVQLRDGRDLTLVSTGGMLRAVVDAADLLAARGLAARVLSMPTVQPLDRQALALAGTETGVLLTVEEHTVRGGLGSAVAEFIAEAPWPVRFRRLGVDPDRHSPNGSRDYLLAHHGLTAAGIAANAETFLRGPVAGEGVADER